MSTRSHEFVPAGWGFVAGARPRRGERRPRVTGLRRTSHEVATERASIVLAEQLLEAPDWRVISRRFGGISRASTYHLLMRARLLQQARDLKHRLGSVRLPSGGIDV